MALIPRNGTGTRSARSASDGNGLNHPNQRKNALTQRAAPAGRDPEWQTDQDGEKQRNAGQFQMARSPTRELTREVTLRCAFVRRAPS